MVALCKINDPLGNSDKSHQPISRAHCQSATHNRNTQREYRLPIIAKIKLVRSESTQTGETGLASFFVGLAQNYPWIATVLLIIGGFRVIFKPVMALLDGYVKANCTPEEHARLQTFESGPIYKWLNFALDLLGSVKLPVIGIKPSQNQPKN